MSHSGADTPRFVHEGQRAEGSVPHTSRTLLLALLFVAFVVGGAGTYAVLRYRAPRAHAAMPVSSVQVTSAVVANAANTANTAEPVTVSVEALPVPSVQPTKTFVTFERSRIVHRVWIDGKLAGSSGERLEVRCGKRTIKVGSHGKPRAFDLPCGGELSID